MIGVIILKYTSEQAHSWGVVYGNVTARDFCMLSTTR
jgi:hypothetical protein